MHIQPAQPTQQNTNFKARVSEQTQNYLLNEAMKIPGSKINIRRQVFSKIFTMQEWGNPNSEVKIVKDSDGKNCLCLSLETVTGKFAEQIFNNLYGRKLLPRFLRMSEEDFNKIESALNHKCKKKFNMQA